MLTWSASAERSTEREGDTPGRRGAPSDPRRLSRRRPRPGRALPSPPSHTRARRASSRRRFSGSPATQRTPAAPRRWRASRATWIPTRGHPGVGRRRRDARFDRGVSGDSRTARGCDGSAVIAVGVREHGVLRDMRPIVAEEGSAPDLTPRPWRGSSANGASRRPRRCPKARRSPTTKRSARTSCDTSRDSPCPTSSDRDGSRPPRPHRRDLGTSWATLIIPRSLVQFRPPVPRKALPRKGFRNSGVPAPGARRAPPARSACGVVDGRQRLVGHPVAPQRAWSLDHRRGAEDVRAVFPLEAVVAPLAARGCPPR